MKLLSLITLLSLSSCLESDEQVIVKMFPHDLNTLSEYKKTKVVQALSHDLIWARHDCAGVSTRSLQEKNNRKQMALKVREHALCLTKYIRDNGSPRLQDWTIEACINSTNDRHLENLPRCVIDRLSLIDKTITTKIKKNKK